MKFIMIKISYANLEIQVVYLALQIIAIKIKKAQVIQFMKMNMNFQKVFNKTRKKLQNIQLDQMNLRYYKLKYFKFCEDYIIYFNLF